jgi:tetratricopeptide (TPR) repeat protein
VVARTGRAETLRALGRLDEALAAYDAAIAAFPRDVYARNGRAETLRALGRLDEALAAYDAAVAAFPLSLVARNGRAGILLDLEKPADVLRALASVPDIPRRREDWVAAHIRCMAELFTTGPTGEAEKRLARLEAACAFAAQRRYFATALAVVRLALRRPQARAAVEDLARSALLPREDRAAVHLLVASAAAADGDVAAARLNIDKAGELVPYEVFQQRRLRQEIERRYGLRGSAALTSSTDRRNSEQRLFRLSCAVTTEMARRAA